MVSKRIIPCLDIKDGRTVKGVNFVGLQDAGDPVELADRYSKEGADDLRKYLRDPRIRKDPATYDRLYNRSQFIRSIKDLPERNSWTRLWYEPASVKAKDYIDRKNMAKTKEQKDRLDKQFRIVLSAQGYAGDTFWEEVSKLRRGESE